MQATAEFENIKHGSSNFNRKKKPTLALFQEEINIYGMGEKRVNFGWSAYGFALLLKKARHREVSPTQGKTRSKALICTDLFQPKTHHFPTEEACSATMAG